MRVRARLALLAFALPALSGCGVFPVERSPRMEGYLQLTTVPDNAATVRLLRQAAEAGDTRAMVNRAYALKNGFYKDREEQLSHEPEVVRLYRAAAERGDPLGQVNLGVMCVKNSPQRAAQIGACQDKSEAVRWFQLAMAQGNGWGFAYYGYMTEHGLGGLQKDPEQAARYYRMAEDHRDAAISAP